MPTAPFDQQTLIEAFSRYDADQNGGKGRSDSPDSGHLGWVHQGMFLYPVARFIELVLKNRALKARYGEKGRAYLDLITQQIAARHERD